jgi:CheY-like chemotaxis protein
VPRWVLTDPTRLRQILLNLIGNGLKFTDAGSVTLGVRLEAAQCSLCFEVRDTGIGLSAAEIGRLFGEFSQADTSITRRYGGTGLGLRISKRLANMLGGDISVASQAGIGSVFTAWIESIPIDGVAHDQSGRGMHEVAAPVAPQRQLLAGVRVLMAEDGVDNRRLVARMLEKQGAVVTLAENGRAAIECCTVDGTLEGALIEPRPFDLVLMDMQMPDMDGYTATRVLREKRCTLPIVALTAHAMAGDREQCLAAGCSDYLSKPIDRAALIAMIAGQISVMTPGHLAT